jgi:hypothetical protein
MARDETKKQRASQPVALDLDAELARIASMTIDQLRGAWRERIGLDPLPALSKDLIARVLSHGLQEKVLGGLHPRIRKAMAALDQGDSLPLQRIKVGSVLVREHEGRLHEVYVVPDGFSWQGKTYVSLSTIARKITGTKWNGPRFFGLREDRPHQTEVEKVSLDPKVVQKGDQARSSIRSRPSKAFIRGVQ